MTEFVIIGLALLWFLPGMFAAIVCLALPNLRRRAIQLHRFAVDEYFVRMFLDMAKNGRRREFAELLLAWQWVRNQHALQVILIAFVLVISGPHAIGRVRLLAKSRVEIRLE